MRISVKSLVGPHCITFEDGETLFQEVYPQLSKGRVVELDFEGVQIFASPFFNAAIGQLLRHFQTSDLNRLVKITNMQGAGLDALVRVIENSRQYYNDDNARKALDAILTEQ